MAGHLSEEIEKCIKKKKGSKSLGHLQDVEVSCRDDAGLQGATRAPVQLRIVLPPMAPNNTHSHLQGYIPHPVIPLQLCNTAKLFFSLLLQLILSSLPSFPSASEQICQGLCVNSIWWQNVTKKKPQHHHQASILHMSRHMVPTGVSFLAGILCFPSFHPVHLKI